MLPSYTETLHYLYANLPMYQRVGAAAYRKDLTNTLALCKVLDDPHLKLKSLHVAGTNGKGSTSHMLASVLQTAGYKTGLYTSPHLKSFTERIRVMGVEVDRQFVVDFVNRIKPHIDKIKPSFFEITVVMAFEDFVHQQVDMAIFEVGMGGRFDSTNVITPEVSLITNIGLDHMEFLGDTLEKISVEKAGIIKPGVPVVISEDQQTIKKVFTQIAAERNAPIWFASSIYRAVCNSSALIDLYRNDTLFLPNLDLPLKGNYQLKNLPGVLQVVEVLNSRGYSISPHQLKSGLENTVTQTGLKGRWQKLGENPMMICDTGHNVDGVREVVEQLSQYQYKKLFIVLGMVKDKVRSEILALLPKEADYYFCQANIPRALEAHVLAHEALAFDLKGKVVPDVNEAIRQAKEKAGPDDFIFIGGSTFVVAEIENL
jgi:dihydrofolate synthase / folylpolyglutamate synthase